MLAPERVLTIALLATLSGWIAWRYHRIPVSQDEGLWMLWGFTGSRPYIEQVDCKPPGIHAWCWLLARISGFNPYTCRLLHQLCLGAIAIAAYCLSGNAAAAIAFIVVAQSAWFQGYFAWVETMSTGLWLLALYLPPEIAVGFLVLAWTFNLKLVLPTMLFALVRGWYIELAVAVAVLAPVILAVYAAWPSFARALWYGCVTVPRRMVRLRARERRRLRLLNANVLIPIVLIFALAVSSVWAAVDVAALAGAALYIAINATGGVWRPYHWIPLAPALGAALAPVTLAVLAVDLISNRFYLGDIVGRRRPTVSAYLSAAQRVGRKISGCSGRLWVYGPFTQLYIYTRARSAVLPVEQVEIRNVIGERREGGGTIAGVDTLVICPGEIRFMPERFELAFVEAGFTVLQRENTAVTEATECRLHI